MLGRTPASVRAVRPLRDGVISDADVTERMLRWFVDQVRPSRLVRPRMVVCVPSDVTGVERRALEDAALRSGARRVYVIEETMAAAIGAGLPVNETPASMVVDIGGGTTDVAIISLGGIVTSRSMRIGGDEIDEAIVAHVKSEYSLLLGERSAEDIKIGAGSAFPLREELTDPGARPRPGHRAAQDRVHLVARGAPGHRDPGRADRRAGARHPRRLPAGAGRRHRRPRHHPHRRRRPAPRPRRADAPRARRPGPRRRRPAARGGPRRRAGASRSSARSSACSSTSEYR